jgi:hypothetical protein
MSSGTQFNASSIGEHDWIEQSTQQFKRVACGWVNRPDGPQHPAATDRKPEVAMVLVREDLYGKALVAIGTSTVLKTCDHYGPGSHGLDFHDAESYQNFMQALTEAGQRAGFINEEDS